MNKFSCHLVTLRRDASNKEASGFDHLQTNNLSTEKKTSGKQVNTDSFHKLFLFISLNFSAYNYFPPINKRTFIILL